jgi:GMP synthase-like glutamine amidotransferase
MNKVLLISTCKEKLHELEFVRPVEEIVTKGGADVFIKHYSSVEGGDLENCDKVIICGTSLRDNKFVEDIKMFEWLKDFDKPVLGICAGMQVLGLVFGGRLGIKKEIGYYFEDFGEGILGVEGRQEVWHLHNGVVSFDEKTWKVFVGDGVVQVARYKKKEIYGTLFHPEVRQKEMIMRFLDLGRSYNKKIK